jgi:hypothetical protein
MAYFVVCRRCGHSNRSDAAACAVCHEPLESGTRRAMYCPVCGRANAAGMTTCSLCGYDLLKVEHFPADQRTLACPYCQTMNPPPIQSDAAAYCINCGRQLRLAGPAYSPVYMTPDKNKCPLCGRPGTAVSTLSGQPESPVARYMAPPRSPTNPSREPAGRYRTALELWQSAYYCEQDRIVFARQKNGAKTWAPANFATEVAGPPVR